MPAVGVLFLAVLIGMRLIYPAESDAQSLPAFKAFYLTPSFFVLRWNDSARMRRSASAGLILHALLVSFAGVDWVESLEPEFHSSIHGLLYLCFTLLAGVAFGIGIGLVSGHRIGASGGYSALLLSMILLWTYVTRSSRMEF